MILRRIYKKMIPELRNLEPINIHSPWKLKSTIFNTDEGLQKYPNPIVEPLIAVKKVEINYGS